MQKKKRQPDASAGRLAIAMGIGGFAIALFSSSSPGQRWRAAAIGCIALSWGLKEIVAAKKWKHEPENEHYAKTTEGRLESARYEKMEKSGSMRGVFELLGWILLFFAVVAIAGLGYLSLFHHRH